MSFNFDRRTFLKGAGAVGAASLLAACGEKSNNTGNGAAASGAAAPNSTGATPLKEFISFESGNRELESWNMLYTQKAEDANVVTNLWDGLLSFDRYGKVVPAIASSWEHNEDATVWTFHLRDDVDWVDNYTLYHVTISNVTVFGVISALVALLVFILMVVFRGRLFCNTLCPVGTLLSLISRYSFFRISFDKEACTHCGNCEHTCKAEAIDSKNLTVDTSRCVDCFNCVSSCAKGGLQYRFKPSFKKEAETARAQTDVIQQATAPNSRRTFLSAGATVAVSLPIVSTIAQGMEKGHGKGQHGQGKHGNKWPPIVPPGAISLERFKDVCTGCQICVTQCPSHVLRPTGLEYGFDYMLKPRIAYIDSYCNYECTVCSEVCPTHAIKPLTKEEKATTQVGIATFFINRCIVKTEGTDCGACSEHCPTQAVHMVPYEGTLTIPQVNPDLCIGCGGCESICPVRPMRAIIIKANEVHKFVEKPKEEEVKKVEIDDFGF